MFNDCLLLLGCERSGTTFVQETLNRYYEVAQGNESQWVIPAWHVARRRDLSSSKQQEKFIKSILAGWYFANQANYHEVYFDYRQFIQPGPFDYSRFVRQVFEHIADVKQKRWVLNKTCMFCEHMGIVDEVFHNPRVIHMIRDGRDVALSLIRVKAWGPKSVYGAARWWSGRVDKIQEFSAVNIDGRYLEIFYDDLISDLAGTFERITKFYGIYDEERHTKLSRLVIAKAGNSGKWRREMSHRDAEIFERVAGSTLERNGYSLVSGKKYTNQLPVWRHVGYRIQEGIISRIGFHTLWFRALRIINRLIGIFPRLQQRFFRSRVFAQHFNWHRNLRKFARPSE